jgi:hypothetical protein
MNKWIPNITKNALYSNVWNQKKLAFPEKRCVQVTHITDEVNIPNPTTQKNKKRTIGVISLTTRSKFNINTITVNERSCRQGY